MSNAKDYAGDVDAREAWRQLEAADAVLVDVRTRAEWQYVGVPDLSGLGKEPVFLEWQVFPTMQVDPHFAERLDAALRAGGIGPDTPVLFICRSGARSQAAAIAMAAHGWRRCFNVAGGFEGPRDGEGHRGTVDGWKAAGLPWVQS